MLPGFFHAQNSVRLLGFEGGELVYEQRRKNSRCPLKLMKAKALVSYAVKQMLTKKCS